jgi:hypothetical protein
MLPRVWLWRDARLWLVFRCYHCGGSDVFPRWPYTGEFCRACGRLTLIEPPRARHEELRG